MAKSKRSPAPLPEHIIGVRVLRSARARRMALRVDARTGDVILALPPRASLKRAEDFIQQSHVWIAKQRAAQTPQYTVQDGLVIEVLGKPYTIEHPHGRGVSCFEHGRIILYGHEEHLERRLKDVLKKAAKDILPPRARDKAQRLNLLPTSVRIIDPTTRWGSCTSDGRLMFSWRLILMPDDVMDYIVAHEVAHRIHLDHSKKFWATCDSLTPDGPAARQWLRQHGSHIMRLFG